MNKKNMLPVILAVDDTPANIDILVGLLGDRYRLKVASDGERALKLAMTGEPPDLVLLDIMMPGMDGFEVCRRLKAQGALRDVPVIFVSALESVDEKVRAFTSGGVDYVTKPFQPEELDARVATHLALRHLQTKLEEQNHHLDQLVRQKSQELIEAHDRLAISGQAKSEFLQLISHEFRTPTNGVLGIADLIFDCFPEGNEEAEVLRPLFNLSRDRMLSTLDDALLLGQIHVSHEDFHVAPVPLSRLLAEATAVVSGSARESGIGIGLFPPCETVIVGDKELFTTAFASLLQTVLAFTVREQTITFCCTAEPDWVTITMQGQGQSLDSEAADFFSVFGSTRNSTHTEELGLKPAVAERIISLYGGSVQIESQPPQGVAVRIRLQKHPLSPECGCALNAG